MRFQGRIAEWHADRGCGFIAPNGGGPKVFVHVRDIEGNAARSPVGRIVTYELDATHPRGPRASRVQVVHAAPKGKPDGTNERRVYDGWFARLSGVVILAFYAMLVYSAIIGTNAINQRKASPPAPPAPRPAALVEQVTTPAAFSCQGKTTCSQMASCEEAKFYLANCPGVRIDGDGDGIPCEDRLCRGEGNRR